MHTQLVKESITKWRLQNEENCNYKFPNNWQVSFEDFRSVSIFISYVTRPSEFSHRDYGIAITFTATLSSSVLKLRTGRIKLKGKNSLASDIPSLNPSLKCLFPVFALKRMADEWSKLEWPTGPVDGWPQWAGINLIMDQPYWKRSIAM